MSVSEELEEQGILILAAEDCSPELFKKLHRFSQHEERIILSLIAHGPVLLRGGRGSGKSALLKEAHDRIKEKSSTALSVYLSLRNLPLLRSQGKEYERKFCELLIQYVNLALKENKRRITFSAIPAVSDIQQALLKLSRKLNRRIVLFFDDAAHLGRETSLTEFFDIFRILSSSSISCKATIYPGVTKFGIRFDVYNDSTVINIARDENSKFFASFFLEVMEARYPTLLNEKKTSRTFDKTKLATFLGKAVIGNMRAFIFVCNQLYELQKIGLPELTHCLINMASNYYWPLLEELKPKLGIYESLIEPSYTLAEKIFQSTSKAKSTSIIIHRDLMQKLAKPLEILEYAGFISRRQASIGMKSGGRGSRFTLNLCNLLEITPGKRLTSDLFSAWLQDQHEPAEIHINSRILDDIQLPELPLDKELSVLELPIESLIKSKAYPYGLTQTKVDVLKKSHIKTIRELAETSDEQLRSLSGVGEKSLNRIRNVLGQAIWM
ncbi:MAG TPA: hypothetical protein EYP59_12780 [Thiotrichaceae bacterium]|nr:hypothetical protein [Thiotrichaceae bacterium]